MSVTTAHSGDLLALATFDAPRFGTDRTKVLAGYLADLPGRVFLTRDPADVITGFLYAQRHRIGPWVAATPAAAEALLARALTLPFADGPRVLAPTANGSAASLLARYGFAEQRRQRHMHLWGAAQLARRVHIYGQASFAIG